MSKENSEKSSPKLIDRAESKSTDSAGRDDHSGARETIKQAAIALFAEKGLSGTSTREIAKESGLNISLISYYFGGKEGLYKAILRENMIAISEDAQRMIKFGLETDLTEQTFYIQMSMLVDLMLDQRRFDQNMMKIMLRERIAGFPFAREAHEEIVGPAAGQFVNIIKRAQEKDLVRKDVNPHTFFILMIEGLWGYVSAIDCGLAMHKHAHKIKKNNEEFKKVFLDIFLKGILK